MGLIDLILDLTGLWLWLGWRSGRSDPLAQPRAATLVGTLKRVDPKPWHRWLLLAALLGLLGLRGWLYQQVGAASSWTPRIDLTFTVLHFRTDFFQLALLYSTAGFLVMLIVFYFWLLILAIANRETPLEHDPLQLQLRNRLGSIARWPRMAQLGVPFLVVALLWMGTHPILVQMGLVPRTHSFAQVLGQSFLVGTALFFTLKYLIPPLLLLYLVLSYVHLGTSPVWDFVEATARGLLRPIRALPWHVGKVDFSPILGILLVVGVLHTFPNFLLRELLKRNLYLWPQ